MDKKEQTGKLKYFIGVFNDAVDRKETMVARRGFLLLFVGSLAGLAYVPCWASFFSAITAGVIFFASLLTATYWQNNKLENKIADYEGKKFRITEVFHKTDAKTTWFCIKVVTDCLIGVQECEVKFESIERNGKPIKHNDTHTLYWELAKLPHVRKNLNPGSPETVNVISVHENFIDPFRAMINSSRGESELMADDGGYIFKEQGDYILDIIVSGTALPLPAKLKFYWAGNRQDSKLTLEETTDRVMNKITKYKNGLPL